ncbi:glycoside hydrolase family 76 protein [Roridomyces roridus]|uniref:Glycoside hydrolase family 76 protein n=1 Tax=Roridomyces roridus TaxID=1738132 RepID=A0AAD7CF94_9AGAR|nr:glycoside hydrolase family 76 protein [Roridomyces roridus]
MHLLPTVLSALWLVSAANAAEPTPLEKRAQCASTLSIAQGLAQELQNKYFSASSGMYNGGSLWTDANAMEDLHNLMLATGTNEFSAVADESWIGRNALQSSDTGFWNGIVNGAIDDAAWIVLALWKIADYKINRGLNATPYLNSALTVYNIVAAQWDPSTCGGGVWWSTAHTYKNAITNQLFLLTSAVGAINFPNQAPFLANALKSWAWMEGSGMRNSQGLWNDGLTDACTNNGQTTWTYNQGVIASGLGALYAVTGNSSLLTQAEITLDATINLLTTNDILRESCDDAASGGPVCNQDQQIFKGLWMKHLQYYLDRANDASRVAKYAPFIGSQSSAVFHFGTGAGDDVGSVWYAPNAGGSIFTPKTSTSGLEAQVCAAKYGPC